MTAIESFPNPQTLMQEGFGKIRKFQTVLNSISGTPERLLHLAERNRERPKGAYTGEKRFREDPQGEIKEYNGD